jgi:hypothetical protein
MYNPVFLDQPLRMACLPGLAVPQIKTGFLIPPTARPTSAHWFSSSILLPREFPTLTIPRSWTELPMISVAQGEIKNEESYFAAVSWAFRSL